MIEHGYSRSLYDSCVYYRRLEDGSFILLMLYVDDMLIAAKNPNEVQQLKDQLSREFDMKDLGGARKILGMEIRRDRIQGKLWLSQKTYIRAIIKQFNMSEAKAVKTPLAQHFKLFEEMCPKTDEEITSMSKIPYASAVGCLMYAMICTRPDLSHAVSVVSRYMSNPGKQHWEAVKWILQYLKGTSDKGSLYSKDSGNDEVKGFVDSDYAGDLDKRRSITGYVFLLGGGPISWKSTLQRTVALSTTEAEYMAAIEAAKEAVWLRGLVGELGIMQEKMIIGCDSQSAICLARNPVYHGRTKHIEIKYHKLRELTNEDDGEIQLIKVSTKDNVADIMTKPVTADKFRHCLNLANLHDC